MLRVLCGTAFLVLVGGCANRVSQAKSPVENLRQAAIRSTDLSLVERWFFDELLAPGGSPEGTRAARSRLDLLRDGSMRAFLARGLDDSLHGSFRTAPEQYLRAAKAARVSAEPQAELVAWFAVHSALDLRKHDPDLYKRWKSWVDTALQEPLHLGWRARGELVDWWSREAKSSGETDIEERTADAFGCVRQLRVAGPFGHGAGRDISRHYAAESFGPWPELWPVEPGIGNAPRILDTERRGCLVEPKAYVSQGVFYAEAYLNLDRDRDLILAVQGATAVWIDHTLVLDRDPRNWGVWPHFGARVRLQSGRHRVVSRLGTSTTSLRILDAEGRPARVDVSTDGSLGYALSTPEIGPDPNMVDAFVDRGNVVPLKDNITRLLAAELSAIEGQSDVASILFEPLVSNTRHATGPALLGAARFAQNDPLFEPTQVRDIVHALHETASIKDSALWEPRLALALWIAEGKGPKDAVPILEKLTTEFPQIPGILGALAQLYRRLGWIPEQMRTLERLEHQFPYDPSALELALALHDARGQWSDSNRIIQQITKLDGDNEVPLSRALEREDYVTALAELQRLAKRRPDRRLILERMCEVMVRAGNTKALWDKLRSILEKNPKNSEARLALADASLAGGTRGALWHSIIDAVQKGAPTDDLRDALDLVEGLTELEPFRLDARKVIRDFEASGRELPGTAARVLDYSALWIHADASARMLEHEVIRLQSAEAIREFSEYAPPNGVILHLRVIKKDGTTLEPEAVSGKSTVTMPHLELGDYVETESILSFEDDDQQGQTYLSPTWFFREEKLAYARSEYVVVSPESRPLVVEKRGAVPPPVVEHRDGLVVRHWRVDDSPAAASEPFSPSARETLPNIRLGWGATLKRQLRNLVDGTSILTPIDPRIVRVAKRIVGSLPETQQLARARKLYRWVLDNVEEGEETDGRHIVIGRHGNRWRGFIELCRALAIPVEYAVAHNRLNPPPAGPFDAAFDYDEPVLRLSVDNKPVWLTVVDKYAPFGYLPAQIRGTQAYRLGQANPVLESIPLGATRDGFDTDGTGELHADGSAHLNLVQTFSGKLAIVLRNVLAQEPQSQLKSFVEGRLFGRALQGSRVVSFEFLHQADLDQPLVLKVSVDVPAFAQVRGKEIILPPPFTPNLTQLVALATRTTPLILTESSEQHLTLRLKLPEGTHVGTLAKKILRQEDREVIISDRSEPDMLVLDRSVRMPAGRVAIAQYATFSQYVREASDALSSQFTLRLGTAL
jgi:tetratricopeptide (TPR) repeat protein